MRVIKTLNFCQQNKNHKPQNMSTKQNSDLRKWNTSHHNKATNQNTNILNPQWKTSV